MVEVTLAVAGIALSVVLFLVGDRRGRRSMQASVEHALTTASQLPASRSGPQGILPRLEFPAAIGYAEVTGDNNRQVLLMYGTGAHATALKVFGRVGGPSGEVTQLAQLATGTGAAFQVGDFNGDGYVEIATLRYHEAALKNRPLVDAPLQPVYYRFDGGTFVEVGHGEPWDPRLEKDPPEHIAPFLRAPGWAITLPSAD
jgi:hypothetical protein